LEKYSPDNVNEGILFFVKYPFTGEVKSRLANKFGKNLTSTLYQMFVEDLLTMLKKSDYPVLICYYPPDNIKQIQEWLGDNYRYFPQKGNDLGERLKNNFIQGFKSGFDNLIVIGSDSPDLPEDIIKKSIHKLIEFDSVIGPCRDGGYYLIGFKEESFSPTFFEGINWSTSSVFEKTIEKLKTNSIRTFILESWSDVDTFDDLRELYRRNIETNFKSSKTMTFLRENIQKIESI
jgi:rSAM/selenodomain-associated transferase 1